MLLFCKDLHGQATELIHAIYLYVFICCTESRVEMSCVRVFFVKYCTPWNWLLEIPSRLSRSRSLSAIATIGQLLCRLRRTMDGRSIIVLHLSQMLVNLIRRSNSCSLAAVPADTATPSILYVPFL